MYLKTNYPLDWWKAILSNASKDEIAAKFWRHVKHLVTMPDINHSAADFIILDDKLIAPMSILHGVGEKAFQQLISHAPYASLESFVSAHLTKRPANNRSAVNIGITRKLVAAGVLDSLFPSNSITVDKLMILEQVRSQICDKKMEAVPEEYTIISSLGQYLIRKQLISVYSEDLRQLILPKRGGYRKPLLNSSQAEMWMTQDHKIVLDAPAVEWIKTVCSEGNIPQALSLLQKLSMDLNGKPVDPNSDDGKSFCAIGYVVHEKTFQYKNKSKQGTGVVIDINGYFAEETLWPPYGSSVAPVGFKDLPVLVHYKIENNGCKITKLLPYLSQEDIRRYDRE
jgi:hypothetical protein